MGFGVLVELFAEPWVYEYAGGDDGCTDIESEV